MPHFRDFLLFLIAALLVVGPVSAQEQQYELSSFDVTVHARPDGAYDVEESIRYDFQQGAFSYAYRSIVREGAGAIRDVRVTSPDASVDSVRLTEEDDRRLVRWAFPSREEPARFDVRYTLEEAIYERGDRNVVSLDVMADGAVVPTHDVDVRVTLPTAFDLRSDEVAVDPSDGAVQRGGGRLVAHFHRDLVEEGDEYSIEVSFPGQIGGEFLPTAGDIVFGVFLFILGIGAGSVLNWRWRGPRPEMDARRPPRDVDLPTAAVLLGNRSGQAIPAVLLDLVLRGHVTLRHDKEDKWFGSDDRIHFDLHPDRSDLSELEATLVEKLRKYETLDDFWSDTQSFRKEVVENHREMLIERGWMQSHSLRSNLLLGLGFLFLLGGFVGIAVGKSAMTFYALFGGIGLSIGSFTAAFRRRTWTEAGARRGMALRSFLDHEKTEIDRLREVDPVRAAERLVDSLPWLVLHDKVSKSWIEEAKDALDEAGAVPEVPDGFVSVVRDGEAATAATAAFLPVVGVMAAMESSGAGAAGGVAAGAGGGGAGAAGAG